MDQLNKIIDILGNHIPLVVPSVALMMDWCRYPKRRDDYKSRKPKGSEEIWAITPAPTMLTALQAQAYIRSLPKRKPVSFEKLFPATDPQGMRDIMTENGV